jgi:hypothetical protein
MAKLAAGCFTNRRVRLRLKLSSSVPEGFESLRTKPAIPRAAGNLLEEGYSARKVSEFPVMRQ